MNKKLIFGIFVFILIIVTLGFAIADISDLGNELVQLEGELAGSNYSWLVNYSVSYPSVEVYEKDSDNLIMTFDISVDKEYKKFLTGWNKTQDVFDLRVLGGDIEFDYVVDPVNQTNISTYENVGDVYHDFIWDKSNIKMQVRSCDDVVCDTEQFAGPDGTSDTWYSEFDYNDLNVNEVALNQYFQFKAYMFRNVTIDGRVNETFTPMLKNVSITFANATKSYIKNPVISVDTSGDTFLNCTTKGYTVGSQVNITFNWTVDGNFYKTENVSSTSGSEVSSVINSTEILPWRVWTCSVQAYDGEYSEIKSTFGNSLYYDTLRSVYSGFIWSGNGMKMQVRSCDDSACSGEPFIGADNTSSSYIIDPDDGNLSLTNLSANRWFQYKVYLEKTVFASLYTPKFYGVNVTSSNMSSVTGCGAITQPGDYILINDSIVDYPDTCIEITASDVVFDCQGYTIDGDDSDWQSSFLVQSNANNITIKNCFVNDFHTGIRFESDNSFIYNCTVNSSGNFGFFLNGEYNNFVNVTATYSNIGISIHGTKYSNFSNILIKGNSYGINDGYWSNDNIIHKLNVINNTVGMDITHAGFDDNIIYNNFFNNTVNIDSVAGADNYFNTTKTRGINILGKNQYIWGNYWASPDGSNYSQTCSDTNYDGICDNPMNVTSGLECVGCSGYNIDEGVLTTVNKTGVLGCGEISSGGNYVLVNSTIVDYPSTCIEITSSDVIFDCQGYTIDGTNADSGTQYGINAQGGSGTELQNVTIKNCNVTEWRNGNIRFKYVENSLIENCSAHIGKVSGIGISDSNYNNINNIIVTGFTGGGDQGVHFDNSNYNNFTNGTISDNYVGFEGYTRNGNIINGFNIIGNDIGIDITHANFADNFIYNNFFNNTVNYGGAAGTNNYFNTTKTASTNIIGGYWTWGNYWTSPTADNYSDTCVDLDKDRICDSNLNVSSQASTVNVGYNVDEGVLMYGSSVSLIDYGVGTNADGINLSSNSIYVNVSINEADISNVTYSLYNDTGEVNSTVFMSAIYTINWTGLIEGNYTYFVNVTDVENNLNSTSIRSILLDVTSPVANNWSGMVNSGDVGGSSVFFNWTVSDNIDSNLTCYPTYSGSLEDSSNVVYVGSGKNSSATRTLSGGNHILNVTCYDNANNSVQTIGISYLVAVMNLSSPIVNSSIRTEKIVRYGDETSFIVDEIDGKDFLNNVSFSFTNSTGEVDSEYGVVNGDQHTLGYTWGNYSRPFHLNMTATAFNTANGQSQNVSDSIEYVYLRPLSETSSPSITSAFSNLTYAMNGTNVTIELVSDLDSLFYSEQVNITDPDGVVTELDYSASSIDDANLDTYFNYTFAVTKIGTYNISALIIDYEGRSDMWTGNFYSTTGINNVVLNFTRNFTIYDMRNSRALYFGDNLTLALPDNGLYRVDADIPETLKNISLSFKDVNLSSNLSLIVNYTSRTNETDAPSGQRRVSLFDMESELNYTNYTLTFDYTTIEDLIVDEDNLNIYKCSNASDCTLVVVTSTVNSTANTISAVLDSMSRFMITEDEAGTTVVTTTVSSGGGGSSVKTVYTNFQILTPGKATMELADKIILPIKIVNPYDNADLKDLTLTAVPNTGDLSPEFDRAEIDSLDAGENTTVNLIIESHSFPGEYEIDLTINVSNPLISENAKVFIRLVEDIGKSFVVERIVLVEDLFKENPQCLELNDYLIEAERVLETDPVKAKGLLEYAISECRDKITSKESGIERVLTFDRLGKWERPVMWTFICLSFSFLIAMWLIKKRVRRGMKPLKYSGIGESSNGKKKKWFSFLKFKKKKVRSKKVKKDLFG